MSRPRNARRQPLGKAILAACFLAVASHPTAKAQETADTANREPAIEISLQDDPPGGLRGRIVSPLDERSERLRMCFATGPAQTWLVRLSLEGNRVVQAHAELDGTPNGVISRCITGALRGTRLPSGLGDSITVRVAVSPARTDGGGGTGEGTIGLGNLGRIGYSPTRVSRGTRARVRTGRIQVRGALSREVSRRVVRRHLSEVRFCYERELTSTPSLAGQASIRFIISPTGAVQNAVPRDTHAQLSSVSGCIARAIRRWVFPSPSGGGVVLVDVPFALSTY